MSFLDIKGQDRPIQILKEYIKHSRLTGSYLFAGEDGIGKKSVAKTLAKALNCESSTLDSCDKCASCLKIEKGQHPDIHIIDGSGSSGGHLEHTQDIAAQDNDSIKIEYIRQLQKEINLRPYEARRKVFIIDNAHCLTADAGNALLKTLEEPPAGSLIILITSKPALLFKTIISRCKIIKFYPLERQELEEALKKDFHLDDSLSHYLAYFCEGRIGRALKLKDTDILNQRNKVIEAFIPQGRASCDRGVTENRNNVRAYLNILAAWFRDMYLIKIGAPQRELINLDRKNELLKLVSRYTFVDLNEAFNSISSSLLYLERNVNTRLLLSNLKSSLKIEA
ncbi:MAG: DNA polymerase III subunit delta' [Candidatus Omnitrophica bacterium]|nr:DNA polymerase III subunit delta' [Candidatus Omnitrophota bacterium]